MSDETLVVEGRAKINLALDVLHKRNDGYHEVAMVMQSIALSDVVTLREQAGMVTVSSNLPGLECGPDNLAYRAAVLLQDAYAIRRGVHIDLEKKIPMAAGLAGGSTDAAAVLVGLNRLWQLGLNAGELETLGAKLGSDVPFCIRGGTVLATGRGEILQPLPALPRCGIVLAKLPVAVSTAWVYGQYRSDQIERHPDIPAMAAALERRDLSGIARELANVLESVTIPAHPEIDKLKKMMCKYGAIASLMSGSGPTVFGITETRGQAESVAVKLRQHTDAQIIVTETAN